MSNGWSATEKKAARRIYDAALERELADVMRTFKTMAANAATPQDMWATEDFLVESRKAIDSRYQYHYSGLEMLFGILIRQGRITTDEIAELGDDKKENIARIVAL